MYAFPLRLASIFVISTQLFSDFSVLEIQLPVFASELQFPMHQQECFPISWSFGEGLEMYVNITPKMSPGVLCSV